MNVPQLVSMQTNDWSWSILSENIACSNKIAIYISGFHYWLYKKNISNAVVLVFIKIRPETYLFLAILHSFVFGLPRQIEKFILYTWKTSSST